MVYAEGGISALLSPASSQGSSRPHRLTANFHLPNAVLPDKREIIKLLYPGDLSVRLGD